MTQTLYRAVTARATKVSDRVRRFTMSTADVALDGHTISPQGWDLSRAPFPMPWAHDVETIGNILGNWTNVSVIGDALVGDANFMDADTNPLADTALRMVDGGWIRNCSVGFIPTEYRPSNRGPGCLNITRALLLECSLVPVPSDAGAVAAARAAGVDMRPLVQWCEEAIDKGKSSMSRDHLTALHRAAAGSAPRAFPMPKAPGASFRSLGEQLSSIASFRMGGEMDPRLQRAPAGNAENDPSAGGFLVAETFAEGVVQCIFAQATLLPLVDARTFDGPISDIRLPAVDEASRRDGSRSGGALAYWLSEAASLPTSFPKFGQNVFSGKKVACAGYVSNELLSDSALASVTIQKTFADEISFAIDNAIYRGTGSGQPLGMLNAPCKIMVAKENAQASKTLLYENVVKMFSRMPASLRRNAVWLINQDIETQLYGLSQSVGTSAIPVFSPANQPLSSVGFLLGRPVIPVEYASTLGTEGDIVFADVSNYILLQQAPKTALSLDVAFTSDQAVMRMTLRCDGMPAYRSAITPYLGADTLSPIVTLQSR